jgi:hypothetical protein
MEVPSGCAKDSQHNHMDDDAGTQFGLRAIERESDHKQKDRQGPGKTQSEDQANSRHQEHDSQDHFGCPADGRQGAETRGTTQQGSFGRAENAPKSHDWIWISNLPSMLCTTATHAGLLEAAVFLDPVWVTPNPAHNSCG